MGRQHSVDPIATPGSDSAPAEEIVWTIINQNYDSVTVPLFFDYPVVFLCLEIIWDGLR
jgi:hypothetical protein